MLLPSETFAQDKDTRGHEFDSLYDARYDNRIVRVRAIFALTGFRENRRRYAKKQQKNTTGDFHQSERGVRLAHSTTSVRRRFHASEPLLPPASALDSQLPLRGLDVSRVIAASREHVRNPTIGYQRTGRKIDRYR